MQDPTEQMRRKLVALLNSAPGSREILEQDHGTVWDTDQMTQEFQVIKFMAPFCMVRRLSDNAMGTLMFQHSPRLYFSFQADT